MKAKWLVPLLALLVGLAFGQPEQAISQGTISVAGQLIEDVDENGRVSDADRGAETLVQLRFLSREPAADVDTTTPVSITGLLTDSEGRFTFDFAEAPSGSYSLVVWWSPGIVDPASQIDPSLDFAQPVPHRLDVALPAERIASGDFRDFSLLVNPKPEGLIPYPVATGSEALPIGQATVIEDDASALPDTGTGAGTDGPPWGMLGIAAAIAGVAALGLSVARAAMAGRR